MPPKRNKQRNKNRAGHESDQPAPTSMSHIRDEDDNRIVEPPPQSRSIESPRDQRGGVEGPSYQRHGATGYSDYPKGRADYGDQPKGARGYSDQPIGSGSFRDQPKSTEAFRDQNLDRPKSFQQSFRDQPPHFQQKATEVYKGQQPQSRGQQEYGGQSRQFQQKDASRYEEQYRQRGPETIRQEPQQGPPRSSGTWQQQTKQTQEPVVQHQQFGQARAPDYFRQQSQQGHPSGSGAWQSKQSQEPVARQQQFNQAKAPVSYVTIQTKDPDIMTTQPSYTQQKMPEESKYPSEVLSQEPVQGQRGGTRAFRVPPQQEQRMSQESTVQQAPSTKMQQRGPDTSQKSQGPWKKPDSEVIEQLEPKLADLVIEQSEAAVNKPTTDPIKPTSESPPTASSSSPAEPVSVKSLTKKVQLKLNFKITPTMEQKFLPKRPDLGGKKGREIKLIINCLDMRIKPMKIFMYDIELTKAEVTSAGKKRDVKVKVQKKDVLRDVVYAFLKDKGGLPVFDGSKIIFTNQMLPINNDIVNKIDFKYTVDDELVSCQFNLQRVKENNIELSDLTHYVESGQGRSDNLPQEALRALDSIMKEMFLNKNLISLNRRAIFDPKTSKPLRCGPYLLLEGFATTIRPHMWKIRFNFDKTQIVIHKPMNLYEYLRDLTDGFRNFRPDVTKKKIHLLRVESNHLKTPEGKSYSRRYTIHGFSKGNAKTEKIEEKNITIEQYYLKEYNIKLKYPNMELIKTNPTKKTYIPMELLTVLPHQKVMANDPAIVQEVIRAAAIPAFDRLTTLRKAIQTLKFGDRADKYIKNYMIEIDENLINVSGRVLEGPEAQFGGGREMLRGGKWDFRRKKFYKPHSANVNWALFAVGSERDYQRNEQPLYDIEEQLPDASGRVGVNMNKMYMFTYISWQRIEIEVPEIIANSEKENKRLDLLVFVITRDEDYKAVKRFGDMTFGIATQCMKYSTLTRQKAMDQYLANIMLKINTKLGGVNWELMALQNRSFSPIKGRFMVFGIDVTHPASTRTDLQKSIAAMVGSLDNTASLYSAVIRQQVSKEERAIIEVVIDTEDMVHKLLMSFYQVNKTLKPEHLIFYRDGVSEGQFSIVFRHEIIAIQNACTRLQPDYQPKITYIVVQKRHKIRFFPSDSKDAIGRSGNVPSGTVVDKDITHCREFDFYLCSHEGIQGTSKPAHYHVLFDENNWGSDDLQSFTYFLCHVYARSTRSVSYPAPTYYAHLAAFRGRALIGELFDDSSSGTASEQTTKTTDSRDSEIVIHDYHNNKLFFI